MAALLERLSSLLSSHTTLPPLYSTFVGQLCTSDPILAIVRPSTPLTQHLASISSSSAPSLPVAAAVAKLYPALGALLLRYAELQVAPPHELLQVGKVT
ncbi:hypothetical protein JCM6882_004109, partial [Rhodosporidiobolus microsporus]